MKSSRSLARHLALSCMQNTVRASRSSGVKGKSGLELRTLRMWNSVLTLPEFRMGEMGPFRPPGPRRGGDPKRASTRRSRDRSRLDRPRLDLSFDRLRLRSRERFLLLRSRLLLRLRSRLLLLFRSRSRRSRDLLLLRSRLLLRFRSESLLLDLKHCFHKKIGRYLPNKFAKRLIWRTKFNEWVKRGWKCMNLNPYIDEKKNLLTSCHCLHPSSFRPKIMIKDFSLDANVICIHFILASGFVLAGHSYLTYETYSLFSPSIYSPWPLVRLTGVFRSRDKWQSKNIHSYIPGKYEQWHA